MADQKISQLNSLTGANTASGDLVTVVDISDTTMGASGTNKKMTLTEFQASPVSAGTACCSSMVARSLPAGLR